MNQLTIDSRYDADLTTFGEAAADELAKIDGGLMHDYELVEPNSEAALKKAKKENLVVVYPAKNQLQIDIDSDFSYAIYTRMFPLVDKYYGVKTVKDAPSKSGLPKRHITLTLYRDVTGFERIALQAALSSDRVRELLGVVQERNGDPTPVLFLEKKPESVVPFGEIN